ncbi:MAG: DUF4250 domain-containing protein [Clostridiales bacterium]|nr:DUF4250 domain-containing protein [Clostridiales bacterium]
MPKDPVMLLSFLNTQLRDRYSSLDILCEDLNASNEEIIRKMKMINYEYSRELNKFI